MSNYHCHYHCQNLIRIPNSPRSPTEIYRSHRQRTHSMIHHSWHYIPIKGLIPEWNHTIREMFLFHYFCFRTLYTVYLPILHNFRLLWKPIIVTLNSFNPIHGALLFSLVTRVHDVHSIVEDGLFLGRQTWVLFVKIVMSWKYPFAQEVLLWMSLFSLSEEMALPQCIACTIIMV